MRVATALVWLALAGAAAAQQAVPTAADGAQLAEVLPEELVKSLRRGAAGYVRRTTDMIASFGTEKGLGPEGIGWKIASDRAQARAAVLQDLIAADLDGDGRVVSDEMERMASLKGEFGAGRLLLNFRAADRNADRVVDATEQELFGDRVALEKVSDRDAVALQAAMLFDLDGDGHVAIDEVIAGIAALQALEVTVVRKDL